MKACKIADKIICSICRDFIEQGNQFSCASKLVTLFPKEPPHLVHAAIRMLDSDGLLSVHYSNNEPCEIALKIQSIQECDENTMLKKGYRFVKEIRDWF